MLTIVKIEKNVPRTNFQRAKNALLIHTHTHSLQMCGV